MKKIILIFFITCPLFIFSQTQKISEYDKVKNTIRKNLSNTMNDYKSYQPVKWFGFEKVYFDFEDTKEGKALQDSATVNLTEAKWWSELATLRKSSIPESYYTDSIFIHNLNLAKKYIKIAEKFNEDEKYKKSLFKRELLFYKVYHTFRGKNAYGAFVINSYVFFVNKDFTYDSGEKIDD
jgi:hypothetical protein